MSVVAVAGGTGDFGQLIVQALIATGRHQVYILSRTAKNNDNFSATVIPTSYDCVPALTELRTFHGVNVVICAFSMFAQSTSDAQVNLIHAADKAPCTTRFLPSEFNVDYDLPDSLLPYADKYFHRDARRTLEQDTSTLEFAYVYTGMFMDYFGMPHIETHLRELPLFIDPRGRRATLPGDGMARMSMSYTKDAARYVALALDLKPGTWSRSLTTAASTVSLNELVRTAEKHIEAAVQVTYQGTEQLLRHKNATLPRAEALAEEFPERYPRGLEQVRSVIADLEVSVALGAFDLDVMAGSDTMDLTAEFRDTAEPPMTIGRLMETAWGSI
ncbi:NmrA-like protein [Akanthomyces lecanii RCEF 1005]|uniref:NmrA-like protein n=1 Tax=Akanthomyces lecanii RCEF 1005 TaxID=1081108 RepID=A0A168G6S0_CORDF|nr:NmrA-like protein [Akanthomyces lecanii RCEF 1005]